MTLKFPLINLISRGHLPLTNRTACLNFAKNIEDGSATRICYEMMKCEDPHDAAKFLEEAVAAHRDLTEGTRAYFAESVDFANARNMILMRESDMAGRESAPDLGINPYQQFMNIVKTGGTAAGVMYLLKLNPSEQQTIMNNLKLYNGNLYKFVQDSIAGRALHLADDPAYYKRLFNSKIRRSSTGGLTPAELKNFEKFKHGALKTVGIGAAIAAGLTAAIVAISLVYKKYFSTEAKACNAYGGKDRTVCMTKARIKACDAAINASKKALLECGSAKNEEDCIFKMKVEIRSWTKKKALEEEKLRKLTNVNSATFSDSGKKTDPFA